MLKPKIVGMTSIILFAGLAALAFAPMPAAAQEATPAALYDIARCAIAKDRSAAIYAVRALPLGTAEPGRLSADDLGLGDSCLPAGAVEASSLALRGAFAQALYRVDFEEAGIEPRRVRGSFADLRLPEADAADSDAMLYKFGDCVARNDLANVDRLVRSAPGSSQEKMLIERLQPLFAPCFPQGAQLAINRATLRGILAQTAYRASQRYWDGELSAAVTRK